MNLYIYCHEFFTVVNNTSFSDNILITTKINMIELPQFCVIDIQLTNITDKTHYLKKGSVVFDIIFENTHIYSPINLGSECFQHFQNRALLDFGIFNSINLNNDYMKQIQELKAKKVCYATHTDLTDAISRGKNTPQDSLNFIIS